MASAGYGSDQVEAINILSAVRSGGSLAVAVLLRPFSFEGRRRLEEVSLCCCFASATTVHQTRPTAFTISRLGVSFFFF